MKSNKMKGENDNMEMGRKEKTKEFLRGAYRKKYKFCKRYQLEDEIKEKVFDKKYNSEEFIHVFYEENNFTETFDNALIRRVKKGTNILLVIYGEQHSGKSYVAHTIAFRLQQLYKEIHNIDVKFDVAFTTSEFDNMIPNLNKGDMIIRDESPKERGKGSRNMIDNLNNVLEIIRKNLNSFIFVAPRRVENVYVTYFLETAGKNEIKRKTRCILYDPAFKGGKVGIGRIKFHLHNDLVFEKRYEERKDANIITGMKTGGLYTAKIDDKRFSRDIETILEHCIKIGVKTKGLIESKILIFNSKFSEEEAHLKIQWDSNYLPLLINEVWDRYNKHSEQKEGERRKKRKENEQEKINDELRILKDKKQKIIKMIGADLSNFTMRYDEDTIFSRMLNENKRWHNPDRDIELYRERIIHNTKYEKIVEKFDGINYTSSAIEVFKKVSGEISRIKGKLLEEKFAVYLRNLKIFNEVIENGATGEFDVVGKKGIKDIYVFSLKNKKVDKKHHYIRINDYYPELSYSREQVERHKKNVYCYLGLYENILNKFYLFEIDIKKPKDINVKFILDEKEKEFG